MFSIKIRPDKPKLIPYYKGFTISNLLNFHGETVSLSYKKRGDHLTALYEFGCSHIKNFHRFKIDEKSTTDEAIIFMANKIEKCLNINIHIEEEIWIGKLVKREYDVYRFPLYSFYQYRKDKEFFKVLCHALNILFRKIAIPYNDYIAEMCLENYENEKEFLDDEEFHAQYLMQKHYRKIIGPMITYVSLCNKKPNYRKFKNKYPEWMEFLKDVNKLDKLSESLLSNTRPFNLEHDDYHNSYVDLDEMYGFCWDNNEDKNPFSGIDEYLEWQFNERMNNYQQVNFYVAIHMKDKNSYQELKKLHKEKTKAHKIISKYYECVYR